VTAVLGWDGDRHHGSRAVANGAPDNLADD